MATQAGTETAVSEEGALPVAARRRSFLVLGVSVVTYSLVQSLLAPVLPDLQERMDTSQSTVTWVITAYLLASGVSTALFGRVGDAVGKKRVLVGSLCCLGVGSLVAAVAPTIEWMIAGRVIQGLGGGVLPVAFGLCRDQYPSTKLSNAVARLSSLTAAGFAAGIVVAGPLVDVLGFRSLFVVPAVATALAVAGAVRYVPESPTRDAERVPVLPAVLLSGWLVALLLVMSKGVEWGWRTVPVQGLAASGVILLLAWIAIERRASVPLIDLGLMRRRGIWTSNLAGLLAGFGTFTGWAFLPQFFQTPTSSGYGFGADISEASLLMLPVPVFSFLVGVWAASIARRTSIRFTVWFGLTCTGLAFVLTSTIHHHQHLIYVWTSLQGIGSGLTYAMLAAAVLHAAPPEQSGVASGTSANIRTIGGALGTAVAAGILSAHPGSGGVPTERGYVIVFVTVAAAFFLASLVALLIRIRPKGAPRVPPPVTPPIVEPG